MLNKLKANSLLSGTAVYLFSNILNAAIPFALLPILTHYLTPAEYGEVAIFQTLLAALMAFIGLNVADASARKYYDGHLHENEIRYFIGACLHILIISTVTSFTFIYLFREQLSAWLNLKAQWILLAVFVTAFSVIVQLRLVQWQVRGEAKRYGLLQISQSAFNMLLSVLLVVVFLQGATGRISAQGWAYGIFALLALYLLRRDSLLSILVWKPNYIKESLQYGVPLIPHVFAGFLLTSIDRIIINTEIGISQAGIYMVAVQLAAGMGLLFDAINKAYVPWLFIRLKRDILTEKKQIVRYTYTWFFCIVVIAMLFFVFGPWLITLIADKRYLPAGEVIGWLALGQAFGGMYLMVTNYVFYSKRTGLLSMATITSGLVNVLLLLLLIKLFGLKGAAIAFSISMAIRFLLTWWLAQRLYPMPWFNMKKEKLLC